MKFTSSCEIIQKCYKKDFVPCSRLLKSSLNILFVQWGINYVIFPHLAVVSVSKVILGDRPVILGDNDHHNTFIT